MLLRQEPKAEWTVTRPPNSLLSFYLFFCFISHTSLKVMTENVNQSHCVFCFGTNAADCFFPRMMMMLLVLYQISGQVGCGSPLPSLSDSFLFLSFSFLTRLPFSLLRHLTARSFP